MGFSQRVKKTLRYKLAAYPNIFIPVYRLLAPPRNVAFLISPDTEIVIEGFPRSGNTFAVVAFQLAQKKKIKIAHHLHAEAQILEGVKRSLPVIVLIREPLATIRSLNISHPDIAVDVALRRYFRFYNITRSVLRHVILAKFEDVIKDYGKIIERVNHKFSTRFGIFKPTATNVDKVFREIERINDELFNKRETQAARPRLERPNLEKDIPRVLAEKAIRLYKRVCFESIT